MASQEPIERLYVKIEADTRELLTKGEPALNRLENKLEDVDKAGKKVGRFQSLKDGLLQVARLLQGAAIAAGAFASALVAAFRMAQQAVADLRVERSFYRLADAAGQSGEDILSAMQAASQGAVDNLTLMRQANLAMQLGVARTAEDFQKLTDAAIILGAAVGRGPTEAINDLIVAAGRRSRLVLDNLGLSLGEVNRLMDQFAQQDFGKTVDQLSQVQRDMLFTRATIEAASQKAQQLGGNVADAGTAMEQITAGVANLRSEFNQTALIFVSLLNDMGKGPGLLQRLTDGAKAWQTVLIQIAAIVATIRETLDEMGLQLRDLHELFTFTPSIEEIRGGGLLGKILRGERVEVEDFVPDVARIPRRLGEAIGRGLFGAEEQAGEAGDRAGMSFAERFQSNLAALEKRFQDILDPAAAAAGLGVIPGPTIDEEPTDESAQKVRDILADLTSDMMDEVQDRQDALEELERDHQQRLADIAEEGARRRAEIERDFQQALEDLARDTARRRAEIIRDAERDLAELAEETDRRLEDERDDFQTDERRATEDHLRDMRRLTEDYLYDLEDAVKERDARAVVDLQRRFRKEQQRREEDFTTRQQREREDFDERLREIREHEAERRQEILDARAEQLQDLMRNEAERRAELERSHAEQIQKLEETLQRQREREMRNYQERQAELQSALMRRLQTIARELADEEGLNAESAQRLLGILNRTFGVGGEIDRLMEDFARRRRQRMIVQVSFEGISGVPQAQQPVFFQHGGTMIARRPTTAVFGEAGPEVAQFIPLSRMGEFAQRPQRLEVEFSGSAPPGIRSTERDQIAGVLLNALRDSGVLQR